MKTVLLAGLALALLTPLQAAASEPCTKETLTVRDAPVTIQYCATAAPSSSGPELSLPVAESYTAPGGSFTRSTTMRFIIGDGPSRVLENVDLSGLGMTGTLHLTLRYGNGAVRIESALLTPGAITIKERNRRGTRRS